MAVSSNKTRITISPTNEVLGQVDELAKALGMSRSAVISFLVVQGIENYNALKNIPDEKFKILVDALKDA